MRLPTTWWRCTGDDSVRSGPSGTASTLPSRRRCSPRASGRSEPCTCSGRVALLAAAAALTQEQAWTLWVGVGLAIPLMPRVGLRENALLLLNGAVLVGFVADGWWAAMAVATVALLIVPGVILLEAAGLPRRRMLQFPPYVPAASIVALAAGALIANFVGPAIGVERPLEGYPAARRPRWAACGALPRGQPPSASGRVRDGALCGTAASSGRLAARSGRPRRDRRAGDRRRQPADDRGPGCRTGDARSGPGASRSRASRPAPPSRSSAPRSPSSTPTRCRGRRYSAGTSPASTQRCRSCSGRVTGRGLHADDAYGAMLSLTLIPASLHGLAGLSAAVILKVVYPVFLALFPVCVFLIARRVVSMRAAYVAGLVIVAQAAFVQQLPAIARQEMALLEFAALLAVLTDRQLASSTRRWLLSIFAVGLVVSHYSTAYATIALLALGLVVGVGAHVHEEAGEPPADRRVRAGGPRRRLRDLVWPGDAGRTRTPARRLAPSPTTGCGSCRTPPERTRSTPTSAAMPVGSFTAAEYQRRVAGGLREGAAVGRSRCRPAPTPATRSATTRCRLVATWMPPERCGSVNTVLLQLVNLLGALGGLALALRRRSSPTERLVGALAVGVLALLAVARLSGTVATFYNLERLSVQALALTGVGLAFLLDRTSSRNVVGRFANERVRRRHAARGCDRLGISHGGHRIA